MPRAALLAALALAARLASAQAPLPGASAPATPGASTPAPPEGQAAPAAPAPRGRAGGAPTGDVHVDAGIVTYEPGTGRYLVEGGAVLRRGAVVLRARTASYDPRTGEVVATGGVLLTDATRAIAADGVNVVLGGPFEAENVVAFIKDGPVELGGAQSIEAARGVGRNRLSLSGASVQGDPSGRLKLSGARLTLCDCGPGHAPSWEVRARGADVIPGKRATFSWPVLYVTPRFLFIDHPVPVLPLPWLYLPLGERQTGFLLPEIVSSGATGFAVELPLFVTLGRSADVTLTPGYAFGQSSGASVRGPSARLEGRWAPVEGALGRAELAWVHDLDAEPGGESGNRYAVSFAHAQRFSERTLLRADVALYGDPFLPRDFSTDILAKGTSYRRSDLIATHAREVLVLEAGASYLQPLLVATEGYGLFGSDVDRLHRWPWASATLLPTLLGPLRVEGRAGATRFAPAGTLDAGVVPAFVGGGAANEVPSVVPVPHPAGVDTGLRAAASRGDVRLEVAAPILAGDAVVVEPFVRAAALGYAFEDGRDPAAQAWGLAGARLETSFGRAFGGIRHRVTPRVEWLIGSDAMGGADLASAYDTLDRVSRPSLVSIPSTGDVQLALPVLSAAPPGRFQQLRAAVDTRLSRGSVDVVRLELGQDYDVEERRFGETFAIGQVRAGPFGADATARFLAIDERTEPVPLSGRARRSPSPLDRFTELRASASLSDRRGDALRLGILSVGRGASASLVAGIDSLFDLRPAPLEAVSQGNAGVSARISGGTVTYDVLVPGRPVMYRQCSSDAQQREVGALYIQQHVATFTWQSPCKCFRVAASVTVDDCGRVSPRATLDLGQSSSAISGAVW